MTADDYRSKLSALRAFNEQAYESFDLDRLLTYAMHVLQKAAVPLYFDYICVAAFKLFPAKFSMANFSEYPDTNRLSKALRRLTDQQRKNWATGNIENGFHLSPAGEEIFNQVTARLQQPEKRETPKPKTRTRGRSTTDDTNEVVTSEVFSKWKQGVEISEFEVSSFLGASPYVPKRLLKNHLESLKQSARAADSSDGQAFLDWLETQFIYMFKD